MNDDSADKITKYRMVRVPMGTYTMLQKYADEMSKLHGFKISLPKALQILLYRYFVPDSHYDKQAKADKQD